MKILKLTMISLITAGVLSASVDMDKKVINFEKQRFLSQKGLVLTKVDIAAKKSLSINGWFGYVLNISANVPKHGIVSGSDILFTNGVALAPDLVNMKDGSSFKNLFDPRVTSKYYKKDHLIAGNENAKNKVVVFSDPLCPFCKKALPGIIQKSKKHPNEIALYYYQFPLLSIHPASDTVSKAMIVAKKEGVRDIEAKIYSANFKKYFQVTETNKQKILDGVNKILKTNITLKDISNIKLKQEINSDVKMGDAVKVQGTPTIFVNGVNDKTRTLFAALAK